MRTQCYDLIGDIHGQYNKLVTLLHQLGYQPGPPRRPKHGESWQVPLTWKHPQGRKVIFLGDYIDRGPNIREVLLTVRGMVEAGDAHAIMGNHEYNMVCYCTPDGQGGFLRPHTERNRDQNQATRTAFLTNELGYGEWPHWLEWMKSLPLFLDLGNLRCVHACWDKASIQLLDGKRITDAGFLRVSASSGTPENRAIETVLKGPEVPATEGNLYRDKEGTYRHTIRSRWWSMSYGLTIGDIAMPPGVMIDAMCLDPVTLSGLPNYGAGEPPVFFGHYWLQDDSAKEPLAPNIACLDYSAGLTGPLVAYRWDGERQLSAAKYVSTPVLCERKRASSRKASHVYTG